MKTLNIEIISDKEHQAVCVDSEYKLPFMEGKIYTITQVYRYTGITYTDSHIYCKTKEFGMGWRYNRFRPIDVVEKTPNDWL
jgi:hypothetical protein